MFSFVKSFLIIVLSLLCLVEVSSQESEFKRSLNALEIQSFKNELEFKYRLFFESVLNIIDNDNNIFSRRNAYYLINNLFENEDASITDYLDNRYPETLTLREYGPRLFQLENVLPLLDKRYKFSDRISATPEVKDIHDKYQYLPSSEQKKKLFQVYKGEVFFIEEIISVQKVRKGVFDAIDRNIVKKLSFKISHDENDNYQLFITSISILDPRNNSYDYNQVKSEIRSSSKPWSDRANPRYLKEIEKEAKRRGITLVGEKKEVDPLDGRKNGWYYDAPTFWDYVVPGLGHLRFGSDRVRHRDAIIHAGATLGSAGLAFHYHNQSKRYFDLHLNSPSDDLAMTYLDKSNTAQRRSDIFKVATVTSYVIDILHLASKNKKQKNLIQKVLGNTDVSIVDTYLGAVTNYSYKLTF